MSGVLSLETRACPECGDEFQALVLWGDDVACDSCNRKAYAARLAAINDGRAYSVSSIGGACPTQAEGYTREGRPYYFRARHGSWTLEVGPVGAGDNYREWASDSRCVANGVDPSAGWMEDGDVLSILDRDLDEL